MVFLLVVTSVLIGVLAQLLRMLLTENMDRVGPWLTSQAVRILPTDEREEMHREWLVSGRLLAAKPSTRLVHTLGLFVAAFRLAPRPQLRSPYAIFFERLRYQLVMAERPRVRLLLFASLTLHAVALIMSILLDIFNMRIGLQYLIFAPVALAVVPMQGTALLCIQLLRQPRDGRSSDSSITAQAEAQG